MALELTGSILADTSGETLRMMKALKKMGVHLSIEDFSTGYSSLSYLMHFPIDYLKIDQSFVRDAPTNPEHASLAHVIASMAKSLHLKIVAEGVENRAPSEFSGGDQLRRTTRPPVKPPPLPADQLLVYLKGQQ